MAELTQISSENATQNNSAQGDANTLSNGNVESSNQNVINNKSSSSESNDLMTMSTPPHLLSNVLRPTEEEEEDHNQRRYYNHRNKTSDLWYTFGNGDSEEEDLGALQKEREERVRKIREQQEEERRKKVEELKLHALQQQKFREQQEQDRRRRLEEQRARENDKFAQVEERRRAIENAEKERRESLLRKNLEREEKIYAKKKSLQNSNHYAFGSCTPRMGYPLARSDSSTGDNLRSSSSMMMSQSMYSQPRRSSERESATKRATSAHGLDQVEAEGETDVMTQSCHPTLSAHRRRTDLMPTLTLSSASPLGVSRSSTPGSRMMAKSPGKAVSMSRLDSLHSQPKIMHGVNQNAPKRQVPPKSPPKKKMSQSMSHLAFTKKLAPTQGTDKKGRSPSALSNVGGADTPVKMRVGPLNGPRKPRPISIATTGVMSTSMYEKRSNTTTPTKPASNSSFDKTSRPRRTVLKSTSVDKEDDHNKSSSSSVSGKTPRKVKAEAAARKAVKSAPKQKSSEEVKEAVEEVSAKEVTSIEGEDVTPQVPVREVTPDIIRKSPTKDVNSEDLEEAEKAKKMIIQSEEEAKARLAEKRKAMKEKMEREAELERQKKMEEERLEAERLAKEEEEERMAMEEAERVAAEAKRVEEERLMKAIEEAKKREDEEKKKREEEEERRKEVERKAEEDARKKQEELDEKLRKDEEERLARKKRLEEIMSRTRGNKSSSTNSTPKKEQQQHLAEDNESTSHSNPDPDPTKPDLLGDINSSAAAHNNNGHLEKGIMDMNISEQAKDDEQIMNAKNEASLLDLDQHQPVVEELDQILDLSSINNDSSASSQPPMATPFIAFEDSITTSPKQEVPTADLLS